ncbi:MAG: DMT family transporter [Isosphaeraceae bacterium]
MTDRAARPALWILTSALIFSAMGAFAHALGTRCDWLTVAVVRALFMLVTSVAVARTTDVPLALWRPRTLWMRSLAGSFSLVCSFYALTHMPIGDVLTLTNTYPMWILALSWLGLRQVPTPSEVLGVCCGLLGVALIERPHLDAEGDSLAAVAALLASFSTAVAMIGLHRLRTVDARAIVAHFAGVASVVVVTAAIVRSIATGGPLLATTDPVTLLLLLGVGLTGTVGQLFLTKAYAAGPPAKLSILGLTQVVFGLGLDVLIWRRGLTPTVLAGTVLVLVPAAWLTRRSVGSGPPTPKVPTPTPNPPQTSRPLATITIETR